MRSLMHNKFAAEREEEMERGHRNRDAAIVRLPTSSFFNLSASQDSEKGFDLKEVTLST